MADPVSGSTIRVVSYNLRALKQDRTALVRVVRRLRPDVLADADYIRANLGNDSTFVLIDARPPAEFTGQTPGDGITRPGHIPGAHNIFWRTALVSDTDLRLRSPQVLAAAYTLAEAAQRDGQVEPDGLEGGCQLSQGDLVLAHRAALHLGAGRERVLVGVGAVAHSRLQAPMPPVSTLVAYPAPARSRAARSARGPVAQ